ncbi:MAG: iron-containing alcohol dehydrogenase [Oscillospiraceae bacterium]|nr:iron-containing alcohol dehydrogenase [Oscillospiraceae bacterium]
MVDFTFYAPTKIYFGKGKQKLVGKIIKDYGFKKIMLHYGKGSIKRSGLYDEVTESLKENGIEYTEFGGVEPNPKLGPVRRGAEICKNENVELILAVGGGSVIDSAKVIAEAAVCDTDPWEFMNKTKIPEKSLPVGVILTLSATGSEMSASAVITNEDGGFKRGYTTDFHKPLFSILNPELTYTVDKFQTACGIVDIMMHTIDRYFSETKNVDIQDNISEGLLRSVIKTGKDALENPEDYEARANLMWAGSLSHNDITGAGREWFFPCHQLEHEISGRYDFVAHGAGLAVVFPAWAKYVYKSAVERFCRFAVNVWNIDRNLDAPEKTALEGIYACENYFKSIGMPVRLNELGIGDEAFDEMAEKCTFFGKRVIKPFIDLDKEKIKEVYKLMLD